MLGGERDERGQNGLLTGQNVIASVGVMFVYNALSRFIIGTDEQRFEDGARFMIRAGDFKEMTGLNEGLAIRTSQVITVIVMLISVAALFWFL